MALVFAAIVPLSIGAVFWLWKVEPLGIMVMAWLVQLLFSIAAARRAKAALRELRQLCLPVDTVAHRRLRILRRTALVIAWLGILGALLFLAGAYWARQGLGASGRPLCAGKRSVGASVGGRGSRWAQGPQPRIDALDEPTREALGRLWLHDARQDHASVPAFARVTWQLSMLGAPPDLLERCHYAGLQEIEHARRCFALAETYLGRSVGVGPIEDPPRRLPLVGNPASLAVDLAVETLEDGCLIEDLNAELAERAAVLASDPASEQLATSIAADEREHAELAWDILRWSIGLDGRVRAAVFRTLDRLPVQVTAPYAMETLAVVARARPEALRQRGRVPFEEWARIYAARRAATVARARAMLAESPAPDELAAAS